MDFKLNDRYILRTFSPEQKIYPVVLEVESGKVFKPLDTLPLAETKAAKYFACMADQEDCFDTLVFNWAYEPVHNEAEEIIGMARSHEEIFAAADFLSQWEDGLQINPEKVVNLPQWKLNHND